MQEEAQMPKPPKGVTQIPENPEPLSSLKKKRVKLNKKVIGFLIFVVILGIILFFYSILLR